MMAKNDILSFVYEIVRRGGIRYLSGYIYKSIRPSNSELEDCVISLISGGSGKFIQDGTLYVKLFYKDILNEDTYFEDTKREGELEALLWNLSVELLHQSIISFNISTREFLTEKLEGIHQHCVILKMSFQIIL